MHVVSSWIYVLFLVFSSSTKLQAQTASGGWLSFAAPLKSGDQVILRGPWDFFWMWRLKDLEPGKGWPKVEQRVEAGHSWTEFVDLQSGEPLLSSGFASYRLRLNGLEAGDYTLSVPSVGGRGRLFVYLDTWKEELSRLRYERSYSQAALQAIFKVAAREEVWNIVLEITLATARVPPVTQAGLISLPILRREANSH